MRTVHAAVSMLMFFLAADERPLKARQRQLVTGLCMNFRFLVEAVSLIIRVFSPDNNGDLCLFAHDPFRLVAGVFRGHGGGDLLIPLFKSIAGLFQRSEMNPKS